MVPREEIARQIRKTLIYMGSTIGGRTEQNKEPSNAAVAFDGTVKCNGHGKRRAR